MRLGRALSTIGSFLPGARCWLLILVLPVLMVAAPSRGTAASPPPLDGFVVWDLETGTKTTVTSLAGDVTVASTTDLQPAAIIGADDRWQVTPTRHVPAGRIAELTLEDGSDVVSRCTGTFIGPDVLITSADCFPRLTGTYIFRLQIVPGADGDLAPYGVGHARHLFYPTEWEYGRDPRANWAIVTIDHVSPIYRTFGDPWLTLGVLTDSTLAAADFTVEIAGYPLSKPAHTQWEGSTQAFASVEPSFLGYVIDTDAGMNGAAVRRASDHLIVGVNSADLPAGAAPDYNRGVRVTQEMVSWIANVCSYAGCSFYAHLEPGVAKHQTFLPLVVRILYGP